MNIPIQIRNQNYIISGDEEQFILTRISDKNKEVGKDIGRNYYYPNIELLLEDLYKMGLRTSDVDSFRGLRDEAEKLRLIIASIADELGIEIKKKGI